MPKYTVTHAQTATTKATGVIHAANPAAAAAHFERVLADPDCMPGYKPQYKPDTSATGGPEYAVTDDAGVKSHFYAGLYAAPAATDAHARVFALVKQALSQQGDDVCWRDLYNPEVAAIVGVEFDPKLLEKAAFLGNCNHFYDCLAREKPYVAPADHYETLRATLQGLPRTWYPDLLRALITAAHAADVFLPGGAARHAAAVESEIGQSPTTEDPSTTT